MTSTRPNDPSDMYSAIADFPRHIREGVALGRASSKIPRGRLRRVLVLGMGGSAIGGDLVRSYIGSFAERGGIDVAVNRGYEPGSVDKGTLVVASSYSGNTEETLAAYEEAYPKAGAVLAITTGGELARRAERNGHRTINPPGGLQPRAALAYGFFPLLTALAVRSELFGADVAREVERGIEETTALLEKLGKLYGAEGKRGNTAFSLAQKINGKVPVIYSAADRLDTVNLRWRGQIQENAKTLAFGSLLPEMNHNEINGWIHPKETLDSFVAIFLRDKGDHERVARRIDITKKIIGRQASGAIEIYSQGESLMARLFSLVHLGDWMTYWLATTNGIDPTPVPLIEDLKRKLTT